MLTRVVLLFAGFRNGAIDGFHDPKSHDVGRSPKSDQSDEGEDDE